jgi:hypothetical protein
LKTAFLDSDWRRQWRTERLPQTFSVPHARIRSEHNTNTPWLKKKGEQPQVNYCVSVAVSESPKTETMTIFAKDFDGTMGCRPRSRFGLFPLFDGKHDDERRKDQTDTRTGDYFLFGFFFFALLDVFESFSFLAL